MGALIRFLNWLIIGTGAVAGYVVIGYAAKYLYQIYMVRQQRWAEALIREYQKCRKEQMDQLLHDAAMAGDPLAPALIGPDATTIGTDYQGIRIRTEGGTFDIPAFYQDVFESPEENEARLREHIDTYAYEMPDFAKDALVEELTKHAFPAELEVQIKEALDKLDPNDFREEGK